MEEEEEEHGARGRVEKKREKTRAAGEGEIGYADNVSASRRNTLFVVGGQRGRG